MSFIEAAPAKEAVESVSVKIKAVNARKLRAYTEFLNGSSIGWTVDQILEEVWKKDKEFAEWIAKHPNRGEKSKKQEPTLAKVVGQ